MLFRGWCAELELKHCNDDMVRGPGSHALFTAIAKGENVQNPRGPRLAGLCVFSPDYIASSLQLLKELRTHHCVWRSFSFYVLYFSILLLKIKPNTKNRQKTPRKRCLDRTILKRASGWRRPWPVLSFRSLNSAALLLVVLGVGTRLSGGRRQGKIFQGSYINSASKPENALKCPTTGHLSGGLASGKPGERREGGS